jgi:hypothetical protein
LRYSLVDRIHVPSAAAERSHGEGVEGGEGQGGQGDKGAGGGGAAGGRTLLESYSSCPRSTSFVFRASGIGEFVGTRRYVVGFRPPGAGC